MSADFVIGVITGINLAILFGGVRSLLETRRYFRDVSGGDR